MKNFYKEKSAGARREYSTPELRQDILEERDLLSASTDYSDADGFDDGREW